MSDITPKQTLVMWCLLGRHGQALQGELVPKVEKKDREALVAAGFVASRKLGRSLYLSVEDKGWRWASEHLHHDVPRGFAALQDWLKRLQAFLEREDRSLAEFIGQAPEQPPPESVKQNIPPTRPRANKRATAKAGTGRISPAAIRARIEAAYLTVTQGRKSQSALLSKVRAQLSDLDRKTVDAGLLRILQGDPKARLGQISDPKALTEEDHEAAFSPGGEAFHLLWIQP
jgi:hypothetical protein